MNVSGGAAVVLRGATLRFGHHLIWENLNLDVAAGECLAVLGPDGAGKTALLKVLLGLLPLPAGTVTIDGGRPGGAVPWWGMSPSSATSTPTTGLRPTGLGYKPGKAHLP